ncbi:MAG: hypothetical protein P8R54_11190 [Myxococcota bacterium]|nr:hypothetical protein [Myxococcota bacterium]
MQTPPCSALFLLLAVGCAPDNNINILAQADLFYQEGASAVDILWVVDDSISMQNEQEQVAEGFQAFISSLQSKNVDFQLGVTTTDMDLTTPLRGRLIGRPEVLTPDDDYISMFEERVLVGIEGSDKERGLQAAASVLLEDNLGFVREDAGLAVIFVSDENDCSDDNVIPDEAEGVRCYDEPDVRVPVQRYIDDLLELKGEQRLSVSSIIGPTLSEGCEGSWPGLRYQSVSERLNGLLGNICEADYAELMSQIGERITDPIRTFYLDYAPIEETIEVSVDDEIIDQDVRSGWTYDAEQNTINFDGVWVPPFESSIAVRYDIAGG